MSVQAFGKPKDGRNILLFALLGLLPILMTVYNGYKVATVYTGETEGVIIETKRNHTTTGKLEDWQSTHFDASKKVRGSRRVKCDAMVGYQVEGTFYTTRHDTCGTGVNVGDTVTVRYDPTDPSDTHYGFSWALTILGTLWFTLIGSLALFISYWYRHGGWRERLGELIFARKFPRSEATPAP